MTFSRLNVNGIGLGLVITAILAGACATTEPPKELVDAREAYTRGEHGKAREYNPAALHEAKVLLDKAEASFKEDGDSDVTKDEAYVALRRAERAEIEAST